MNHRIRVVALVNHSGCEILETGELRMGDGEFRVAVVEFMREKKIYRFVDVRLIYNER